MTNNPEAIQNKDAKAIEVTRVTSGTAKALIQKDNRRPNSVFCSVPPVFSMSRDQAETFINELADLLETMEE